VSALRAGLVGFGLAGQVFHAPLIASVDGLELAGIVTRNPERAAIAAAAYPGAEVVAGVSDLWGRVDLLVIATSNSAHMPLALEAIEHGVAMVVDKPLAVSAADAQRLVDAARSAEVPLTVFQNRRWDGDFLTLKRLLPDLGSVTRFESRFERFRPEVQGEAWREAADAAEGGGLLLDLGAHLVDQARELFGPPLRLYAELEVRRPGAQVEDDVFIALEHAGGERSHLWMSAVAPLYGPRFRLSGTRAGFAVDGLDPQEPQLAGGLRPGDESYGVGAPGALVHAGGRTEVALERGAYETFYAAVVAWLRDGAPPPVDPRDSVAVLHLLDAARRSAASHSVIDLEDSP
jgi:scyllo-inositol 2-dehydrogenase (NADP+)